MDKNFDDWNELKKKSNTKKLVPLFAEREVWWCSLGVNIGFEEDGKGGDYLRPVLIVRKFNKHVFYAIPITSKKKQNHFHYLIVAGKINGSVILSQMKLIDAKRLFYKMGKIDENDFFEITKKLKALIP